MGRTGATAGPVSGHEPLGVVEPVGSAVEVVEGRRPGGDPRLTCIAGCAVISTRPAAAYGYSPGVRRHGLRRHGVPTAERRRNRLRVPFATPTASRRGCPGRRRDRLRAACLRYRIGRPTRVCAAGWHGCACSARAPSAPLAAYSALLKGAAEVYVVDGARQWLDKAGELGATATTGPAIPLNRQLRRESRGF